MSDELKETFLGYGAEYDRLKQLYEHIFQVLNDWVYGVQKVAMEDGEKILRKTERIGVTHWIKDTLGLTLEKVDDPYDAIEKYLEISDKKGLLKKDQCQLERNGEKISISISGWCVYQKACKDLLEEGATPICARTIPFLVAMELTMGEEVAERYRCEAIEINPGTRCKIEIIPVWWLSSESK